MLSAWSIAARRWRVAASFSRASMAMMPCPTAGMNSSASSVSVAASARPSRLRPASASSVASTSPASSLRSRVSTLPRNDTTLRSGRSRFTSACRRSEAVPTTAPAGSSRSDFALRLMKTSRGSSRGSTAAMIRPVRQYRRHVLGGMHGDVDLAGRQRLLDLLGEESLAAEFRQRTVADGVAGGRYGADLDPFRRPAMRGRQAGPHHGGLGQRERTAARPDPQGHRTGLHLRTSQCYAEQAGWERDLIRDRTPAGKW